MKIYLGFTVAGDRSSVVAATKIVELLVELGHEVLTRHLIREDAWKADRSISPQEVYRRDMTWLKQCDLFVAEVSGSSFGLGFETGYLLGATAKKVALSKPSSSAHARSRRRAQPHANRRKWCANALQAVRTVSLGAQTCIFVCLRHQCIVWRFLHGN